MSRIDGDSEQFLHVIQRNLFHFVNSILLCAGVESGHGDPPGQ